MSLGFIEYAGKKVLFLNLEKVSKGAEKLRHIEELNKALTESADGYPVLVNVKNFLPGPGLLDLAASTLSGRAEKVLRVAYIGIGKNNRKMFDIYDKYTFLVVERKLFDDEDEALRWLTED